MKSIQTISSIPSSAANFSSINSYFSGNSFYTPEHLISLPSLIISCFTGQFHFLLTKEKLYQVNKKGIIITTMKINKRCGMVRVNKDNVILFFDGSFEVYSVPKNYQTVMYKLKQRKLTESGIICVDFYESFMICGCDDNSVRLYEVEYSDGFLGSFMSKIIGCFMCGENIVVVTETDIFFYLVEFQKADRTEKNKEFNNSTELDICLNENIGNLENNLNLSEVNIKSRRIEFTKKIITNTIHLEKIMASCFDKTENLLFIGRENDNKTIIEIYKGSELYLTPEIECTHLKNMIAENSILVITTNDKIIFFDYKNNIVIKSTDVSNILTINTFNNYLVLGTDRMLRIYRDYKQVSHHKLSSQSKIRFIHACRSILLTISSLGTVKLYDIQNFHNFKTFDIDRIALSSDINEDGSLLFLGNESILIYDTKRGSLIDELKSHTGPICKMKYKGSFLYSLGMDNYLRKQYIYDTKIKGIELESINKDSMIDFDLYMHLYVLTTKEIIIYDLNFNFVKSIILSNTKKIIYEKVKVLNNKIVVYGHTKNYKNETINYLQVYSEEHSVKIQESECEEVKDMKVIHDSLFLLTNTGIKILGNHSIQFDPVDLEIDCTPENIDSLISQNKLLALIASVKLNDFILVERVVKNISDSEICDVVRYFPEKYIPKLREHINKIEVNLEWVKNIIFWHTGKGTDMKIEKSIEDGMKYAKINHYILKSYERNKK